MDEKKYKADDWVIKQGDDGDNLYVIDSGALECYKQFEKHSEPKHVKTYNPTPPDSEEDEDEEEAEEVPIEELQKLRGRTSFSAEEF